MTNVCRQHIGEEYVSQVPEEPFFVDFLRDAPEPTGEETDDANLEAPKIYEQVNTKTMCFQHRNLVGMVPVIQTKVTSYKKW